MRTKKNIRIQKRRIYSFVVDGECEYWYLQMLKDNEKSLNIHLSPEIYKKKTLDEQYKRVMELVEENEKVFWIIDFDVIDKETREAGKGKKTALQKFKEYREKTKRFSKIEIIINNPCLEFWFLLHFVRTNKFYKDYDSLLPDLQKHLDGYEKTEKYFVKTKPDIYRRLKSKLNEAKNNAEKCGGFDFENTGKGLSEMQIIFRELGFSD